MTRRNDSSSSSSSSNTVSTLIRCGPLTLAGLLFTGIRSGSGPHLKEINGIRIPAMFRLSLPQIAEPAASEFLGERAVFPAFRSLPNRPRHGGVT